jgi:hypothetical protein
MSGERVKLEKARDDIIEQATEAAMYGSGHDELDAAVYRYLRACGDDELAADMIIRNRALATAGDRP